MCTKFVRILLETRYLVGEGWSYVVHRTSYAENELTLAVGVEKEGETRDLSRNQCNTTHCHGPIGN